VVLSDIQASFGFRCYYVLDMSRLEEAEPVSALFPFNIDASLIFMLEEGLSGFATRLLMQKPGTLGPLRWDMEELEEQCVLATAVVAAFRAHSHIRGVSFPALGISGAPRLIGFAGDRPHLDVDEVERLNVFMVHAHEQLALIGHARTEALQPLTDLERQILLMAAEGESLEAIGAEVALSSRTIKYIMDSISRKMEVANIEHAVAVSLRRRLDL
jgi:DNA-binding CsgD family transcriptional regulator